MTKAPKAVLTPGDEAMFSLTLLREVEDGPYKVIAVDVRQPNHRHRITLSKNNEVGKALSSWLAAHVRELLTKIDRSEMVIYEPDAVFELPGLVLGRLRMLVHTNLRKVRQVILRFSYFVGGLQAAFRFDTHIKEPVVTERDAMSVAVISDICHPAFDILSPDGTGLVPLGRSATKEEVERYGRQKEELAFYVDLLRRYVDASFTWLDGPERQRNSGRYRLDPQAVS